VSRLLIDLGPGICLTTEENHSKTSVKAPEKCSEYQRRARFVWSTWPSTSGSLDWTDVHCDQQCQGGRSSVE
jgi:hypothetical protein